MPSVIQTARSSPWPTGITHHYQHQEHAAGKPAGPRSGQGGGEQTEAPQVGSPETPRGPRRPRPPLGRAHKEDHSHYGPPERPTPQGHAARKHGAPPLCRVCQVNGREAEAVDQIRDERVEHGVGSDAKSHDDSQGDQGEGQAPGSARSRRPRGRRRGPRGGGGVTLPTGSSLPASAQSPVEHGHDQRDRREHDQDDHRCVRDHVER